MTLHEWVAGTLPVWLGTISATVALWVMVLDYHRTHGFGWGPGEGRPATVPGLVNWDCEGETRRWQAGEGDA